MKTSKPLRKDKDGEEVDVHTYRSMIGSLMYLTSSRPDIMFVVCACARYQVTPKVLHLHDVKRIFRYLNGQPKLGLWYPKDSPFDLVTYTDSDYAGASLDRKSTTGGCQFLGCRLISWQCKKQTVVANSTTEAEYVDASSYYSQVLWIQNQLLDYRLTASIKGFHHLRKPITNSISLSIIKTHHYSSKFNIMSTPKFATTHNLIAFLEKPSESDGFEQIVDFLNANPIKYALTVSLTIYTSCIKQFWTTVKIKIINDDVWLQALIDGKRVVVNEAFIRHDLNLNDAEGIFVNPSLTKKVFANMKRVGTGYSGAVTPLFGTMMVQALKEVEVNLENVYNLDMAYEETVLSMQDVDVQSERIGDVVKDVEDVVATAENVEGDELKQDNEKKQKLEEQEEAKELKQNLEIVPDDEDDVFVNVTPLSSKPPTIVDYKIYKEGKNEHFQIFRAKWFKKSQPKEVLDVFLWHTLNVMFEHTVEDNVCKHQKGPQGLARVKNWKLFDSYRVHCVTLETIQLFLLAKKMYPLTNYTLQQLFNKVRLQVDYEVEMAYDLLRLVRKQLKEGYVS
nr:uncharacterized mitochondrial protein AtMg00810-like [Tanacetum cinerariifolium]